MKKRIYLVQEDHEILYCYPVMAELRPHLQEEVKAVAGFRVSECLASGKFLYVDDLVAKSADRSKGYGGELFDWLVEYAKQEQCDEFQLDSRVHRFAAHRFYLKKRMIIEAHHFTLNLSAQSPLTI